MARRGRPDAEARTPGIPAKSAEPETRVVPACRACAFYVDATASCHRYPPTADFSPPRMPKTAPDLWCGEFASAAVFRSAAVPL